MSTDDKHEAHMAAIWAVSFSAAAMFAIAIIFKNAYPNGVHVSARQAAQAAQSQPTMSTPTPHNFKEFPDTLVVGASTLHVVFATTSAQQALGLSGRTMLPEGAGMLFVFPEPAQYSFWMKDMNFSIDIVWINSKGVVIDISPDISPDTYPTAFAPSGPVTYVLEVPAGYASRAGIKIGDIASPLPRSQ